MSDPVYSIHGRRLGRPSTGLSVKMALSFTEEDAAAIRRFAKEKDIAPYVAARVLTRMGIDLVNKGRSAVSMAGASAMGDSSHAPTS